MKKNPEFKGIELKPWQINKSDAPAYKEKVSFSVSPALNGILRLVFFSIFVAYADVMENKFISLFPSSYDVGYEITSRTGGFLWKCIAIIVGWIGLVRGIYFLYPYFISGSSNTSFNTSSIDRVKSYRNAKLSTMDVSDASEEYKKTAWVDSFQNSDSPQVTRVMNTINSKLSILSQNDGYDSLKK